ncbi:MAG TPA: tellurite resistance/C4-dicarboxylate transporter family protein [Streptosporangiaceae bacterium]
MNPELLRAVRGADPRSFAMVMATGIVSVALRQAGAQGLSAALLWVAVVAFAVLVVASAWRVAAFGQEVRGELRRPDRVFSYFAFPAAASVVAARLAGSGSPVVVAVLVVVTVLAWVAVTCLVLGFPAFVARARRAIADVNGTWELWVVGTQSTAIAATSAYAAGVVPARLAAWAAIVVWSAGAVLYPVITGLVITRLLAVGLRPDDLVAPYWVTMGAASITVLGAAQTLPVAKAAALAAVRPALTGLALIFWSVATGLIPALAVLAAGRRRSGRTRRGFHRELWMIVFPAGMYATASMRLGAEAGLTPIRDTGTTATWVAAAVWAAVFTWMTVSAIARRSRPWSRRRI